MICLDGFLQCFVFSYFFEDFFRNFFELSSRDPYIYSSWNSSIFFKEFRQNQSKCSFRFSKNFPKIPSRIFAGISAMMNAVISPGDLDFSKDLSSKSSRDFSMNCYNNIVSGIAPRMQEIIPLTS